MPGVSGPDAHQGNIRIDEIVSPDALALVRFGLRAADDPRILSTVKVIDSLLKAETPHGVAWCRYNGDGYGEKADGSPFDPKTRGIGRAWPLLTGERAHYELAAGRHEEAVHLMQAMETLASQAGMIPEQVWNAADIPEQDLFHGRPTGSAMPLVWRTPSISSCAAHYTKVGSSTGPRSQRGVISSRRSPPIESPGD